MTTIAAVVIRMTTAIVALTALVGMTTTKMTVDKEMDETTMTTSDPTEASMETDLAGGVVDRNTLLNLTWETLQRMRDGQRK